MYTATQFAQTQLEIRKLRIENANRKRWHLAQKQRADRLEDKVKQKEQEIKQKNKEVKQWQEKYKRLRDKVNKIKKDRDVYKGMVFKPKKQLGSPGTGTTKRSRGGQAGHQGFSRKLPKHIDQAVDAFLTNCPHCRRSLKHAKATTSHTVTDLPTWGKAKPIITKYTVERQWCKHCKKEVRAVPKGVIPGSRLGSVLLTMVMMWRYRMRLPLAKITELLKISYNLTVSEGAVQSLLAKGKIYLGSNYEQLQKEVRGSPVKYADETSWRVNGENWWCWLFATDQVRMYTIEETRGKGVPERILGEDPNGVLVRDDYTAYKKLPLLHQSCWTHLLRKSHEAGIQTQASEEIKVLHSKLKILFDLLSEDIAQKFDPKERKELHGWYVQDIENLIWATHTATDAKQIQTRIKNQGDNLLTALLHPGVPLTNNTAERAIRPMVVTRKISGGSKTSNGAQIHAVNMSMIETILARKQPLLNTLHATLLQGAGKS